MKDTTKILIQKAYLKLIEQKDADKITVKDIARESNVNRNTFYYHYQDIGFLVKEIIQEQTDIVIAKYPTTDSLEEGMDFAIKEALKHKRTLLHFYSSSNRQLFEDYLWQLCDRFVSAFSSPKSKDDTNFFVDYQKCFLFGLIINWFNKKMPEQFLDDLHKAFEKLDM